MFRATTRLRDALCCVAVLASHATLARTSSAQVQPDTARAPAPLIGDSLIAPSALREDARVLRAALEALHPGLYRYLTPAEVERRFARLEARFATGRTRSEAFLAIAELTAALRCGHTYPNPNNQSRVVADAVFRRTPRVPFHFRWLGRRMIVTKDLTPDGRFPTGTEVIAINGTPASVVLARLLRYARADGGNDAKRVANLEVRSGERWPAFDIYYPLVFAPPSDAWAFRVKAPRSATRTITALPVDAARRLVDVESLRQARTDTTAPPWTTRVESDGLGILTMPTWVTFNDRWDWQVWVHRSFEELTARGARALVIDLRGNEGGTSVGDVLLAHLVGRDIVPGEFRRFTRYRQAPQSLRPYLDTWDRSFDDWGSAATPSAAPPGGGIATGFYRMTRWDDTTEAVVHPVTPRFSGRVFVLVDADNSSATFEFAEAARQLGVATLVGAPTGGNQRGINGGAFYFVRLPNSRIEVDLPLVGFFAPGRRPDAGLLPDIPVTLTARDIAEGRDPALDAVRRRLAPPARRVERVDRRLRGGGRE